MSMTTFVPKLVATCLLFWTLVVGLISPARAQTEDGSAPADSELTAAATSARATTTAPQVATSTPSATQNPVPGSSPRPTGPTPDPTPTIPESAPLPTNNQPILFVPGPVQNQEPAESSSGNTPILAAIAGVLVLGGYALYRFKANAGAQNKNINDNKEDQSRCFDIQKLMEEKLEELIDLRGKLESKAEGMARDKIKEAAEDTPAAEAIILVERAEKEYTRLKQLYEKCRINLQVKKRVFIVHGWDGAPYEAWLPWLKEELEKRGYYVEAPEMPRPEWPKIEAWVLHLAKVVGEVDENTFFVGHSVGCQTILRYLEELPTDKKVGGAVFVAGWFTLTNLEAGEATEIAGPWLKTPINFEKVKRHTQKFFAVFSDNDQDVPMSNKELFEERLGAQTIIEHGKGHFSKGDGIKEIPVVLEKILEMST